MNPRLRFVVPLAACLVLGGALLWALRDVSSAPSPETSAAAPSSSSPAVSGPSRPGPSVPSPSDPSGTAADSAPAVGQELAAMEEPMEAPLSESEEAKLPPQENDPIEPELPQTAAWRHEKLVRITGLLDRDVERLEGERQSAQARGDEAEARRLTVQLARHRARLGSLREETAVMAEAARQEEQAR